MVFDFSNLQLYSLLIGNGNTDLKTVFIATVTIGRSD